MKRRLLLGVLAATLAGAGVPAQQPSDSTAALVERTGKYVEEYERTFAAVVSEEFQRQTLIRADGRVRSTRELRSDFLLVKTGPDWAHVFRDVIEVDGRPVRNREDRLRRLFIEKPRSALQQARDIAKESARYNIGGIQRNVNTPVMPLQFLDKANQQRFEFKHVARPTPVFSDVSAQPASDAGVFRVTTEMWTIEYRERGRNTIIRRPNGARLPVRGRFWIDPSTGAVLISEMVADGGGVTATVTVSYQSEPLMGFLVPVEMRESYVRRGERISGHAVYERFRLLKQ